MNLSKAVFTARSIITANSPVLLVGTAVAGCVSTGILAARGGYKARGIVDDERMRRVASPEPPFDTFKEYYDTYVNEVPALTATEKAQLTWLCYAVPAVTGASTIASVVGVHTIHTKRHAALAGLYAVTSGKLDDYREKAEELLGTKKTQELNNSIAQKSLDKSGVDAEFIDNQLIVTDGGTELMYDETSGRYFAGSIPKVEKAIYDTNMQLAKEGEASLNDFWDGLGLSPLALGHQLGWSGVEISPRFGSVTTPDGRSAVSVWFHETPSMGWDKHH